MSIATQTISHPTPQTAQTLPPLVDFASVIARAVERAGSRAELARMTGITPQSLYSWQDKGETPSFTRLMESMRQMPESMVLDLLVLQSMHCRRLNVDVSPVDQSIPIIGADLVAQAIEIQRQALNLMQAVVEAMRDGRIDGSEASNVQAMTIEGTRTLKQLAMNVLTAASNRQVR
jgi:hypothetical protein